MTLYIETIYYKQTWFRGLVALALIGILYGLFRFRINKQRQILTLEAKATSLEKEKAQVQYENLKQQLNPHFLFNSLSSLRGLIRENPPLATGFLDGLSKTYRYLLRSRDHELVPLSEEISFVETFVQLLKTRFEAGLQLTIRVPEQEYSKRIAPVTLQGLIENAVKHNMISTEEPLCIEIDTEGAYIQVRNNLQKLAQVETSNKKGLEALRTLYSYFTPLPLLIREGDGYFTVSIPLL